MRANLFMARFTFISGSNVILTRVVTNGHATNGPPIFRSVTVICLWYQVAKEKQIK